MEAEDKAEFIYKHLSFLLVSCKALTCSDGNRNSNSESVCIGQYNAVKSSALSICPS